MPARRLFFGANCVVLVNSTVPLKLAVTESRYVPSDQRDPIVDQNGPCPAIVHDPRSARRGLARLVLATIAESTAPLAGSWEHFRSSHYRTAALSSLLIIEC